MNSMIIKRKLFAMSNLEREDFETWRKMKDDEATREKVIKLEDDIEKFKNGKVAGLTLSGLGGGLLGLREVAKKSSKNAIKRHKDIPMDVLTGSGRVLHPQASKYLKRAGIIAIPTGLAVHGLSENYRKKLEKRKDQIINNDDNQA